MNKIKRGFVLPSAAFSLKRSQIRYYEPMERVPEVGDVFYGEVVNIGQHSGLENTSGRIHQIHDGTKAIFVFGNRYAPDYYEALMPQEPLDEVDLTARSGLAGVVICKNALIKDPTRIKVLGYVCDGEGKVLNTRNYPLVRAKHREKRGKRSKMILVCGTSMNSGKSLAAAACCRALSTRGIGVRGCKVTGTASLKDILHMNDAGASYYADFTYLGYPSTYMLSEEELLHIFDELDLKYANNPENYWVVELADGVIQRETAMLLRSEEVKKRIHRFVFCAADAFGAIGGLDILKNRFGLTPDLISGLCSSSPLLVKELQEFTTVPIFNSAMPNIGRLVATLTGEAANSHE
ncbi:MAG: hypothetical protein JW936_08560 [Sedimentisphaerales bacterium]|nr:hypothetical protein [Sedimentisphaerales bacterium]